MDNKNSRINKIINTYISNINNIYQKHEPTEYSYRRDFGNFLTNLMNICFNRNDINFFEERKHYKNPNKFNGTEKNAPDYTIYNKSLTIGVLETKLPDASLLEHNFQKQFNRYKHAFSFVIFSNYLKFSIWKNGKHITDINIGTITIDSRGTKKIVKSENALINSKKLSEYIAMTKPQKIGSIHKLAIILANLSKLLSDDVYNAINLDERQNKYTAITHLYESFKHALIKDITYKMFSDYFAQTITYGMLSAKLNTNNKTFTRKVAINNIPKTDPFLYELFKHVAGKSIDSRIEWGINAITNAFNIISKSKLVTSNNNLIDFYETFLKHFNNKTRKERGVWYTPKEIAKFIVKSVDNLLINKLSLNHGLATPTVKILDPATGTGTFLSESVKKIYQHFQKSNIHSDNWIKYIKQFLPQQINAFEILIASYTIAHLNLYLTLLHTLPKHSLSNINRFNIFLTNSLTPAINDKGINLLEPYMANEERDANKIKSSSSIMVILGNPPYNRKSQNNNKWINTLLSDYTKGLGHTTQNGVHDDYIKFIRLAEEYIHRKKMGIVGYITNSSYLNGPSCRIMRKHLATTFNDIYVINLHGGIEEKNLKNDESVFGIRIPVAISIFVKSRNSNRLANIHYIDITGSKQKKLSLLNKNSIADLKFNNWACSSQNNYKFIYEKNIKNNNYNKFIPMNKIFNTNQNGIITGNDNLLIHDSINETKHIINELKYKDSKYLKNKYKIKDKHSWNLQRAKKEIKTNIFKINKVTYRPLDYRFMPYSLEASSNSLLYRPCTKHMSDMLLNKDYYNYPVLGLVIPDQISTGIPFNHAIVTKSLITNRVIKGNRAGGFVFPLQANTHSNMFMGNFTQTFLKLLNSRLKEKIILPSFNKCKKVLAWIIAILNSPQYLKKYNDKLKDGFARIPLPNDQTQFNKISAIGYKLIDDYTLTNQDTHPYIFIGNNTDWTVSTKGIKPYDGSNKRLYINENHYLENVDLKQYTYNIAGYDIIKQWLKDRQGINLTQIEIEKLQKILSSIKNIDINKNKLSKINSITKF